MVVPMKKLSVLLPAADREEFLKGLARVGVVHIEERVEEERHSADLEVIAAKVKNYRYVLESLEKLAKETAQSTGTGTAFTDADAVVKDYSELEQQRDGLQQKIAALQKDSSVLHPWGNFDTGLLEKLETAGVKVRFFETDEKKFSQIDLSEVAHTVVTSGSTMRFVVFDRGEGAEIDADEISLPKTSLVDVEKEIAACEKEIREIDTKLTSFTAAQPLLKHVVDAMEVKLSFERARLSLEEAAEGAVLLLTGWFPAQQEKNVGEYLEKQTVWYDVALPSMEEQPPVKLRNSAFAKLFEPITKMFSLPDYFELDPTPFFAPFFMFFYGLCLGDVGYGLLLLIAGVIMLSKGPQKMKGIFVLITFLGAMTVVNGFFLNSFFGASIFSVKGVKGLAGSGGPLPFLGPKVIGGNSVFPAMTFSIYIGFIQMMLGMLMQITNRIRNKGLLFAVQPMCYIPMSLAVFIFLCKVDFLSMGSYEINGMQIGAMIAGVSDQVMKVLVLIGIVPFVFLNTPTLKIFLRPLMALYELYNFANDLVSSGLSYLRLFALGLAGGLLGNAFNEIALMLISNEQGEVSLTSPLIIFTVLIMVAGHALNFFLSALGAYVHSVRLMFVEFYKFVNFEGGGTTYVPFSENVTNNN